jgi:Replication protein
MTGLPAENAFGTQTIDRSTDRRNFYRRHSLGTTKRIMQGGGVPGVAPSEEPVQGRRGRRSILMGAQTAMFGMKSGVHRCLRSMKWEAIGVGIQLGVESAFYSGLMVCGLIWICPVCAWRISRGRRAELKKAIDVHLGRGGSVWLLTLTFPHYAGEDLGVLYKKMRIKARRKMLNRPGWKRWAESVGFLGSVCAVEVTHGENGWHIHTHEILFVKPSGNDKQDLKAAAAVILPLWQSACEAAGLPRPSAKYGINLQNGDAAASYVSKWGLEGELTRWHAKKGKLGGKTAFDFLRDVVNGGGHDCESAELFRVYARELKGKRQLVWTDGLWEALLGDEEQVTDEELVEQPEEPGAQLLGVLSRDEWKVILASGVDRFKPLEIAWAERSWEAVLRYVEGLGYVDKPGGKPT